MTTDQQEALREDCVNVSDFLRGLAQSVPGVVPDDLLALLDSAATNPAALAVLSAAMKQGPPANGRVREAVHGRR